MDGDKWHEHPRLSPHPGAGAVLSLIRSGQAVTRADLARVTGLPRSTLAHRVDALLANQLIHEEEGGAAATGGRPAHVLAFNHDAGVVLAADLGGASARLAVTDLAATPLAEAAAETDLGLGPEQVLGWVYEQFVALLHEAGRGEEEVLGASIGIPDAVDFSTGLPINPRIMPEWDGFSIPQWFASRYDVPVVVDEDVNMMAFGEHWFHWQNCAQLLFIKMGTGIGCGVVVGDSIYRGSHGTAGDIGHIRVAGRDDVICRCGNLGCLEAVAGAGTIAVRLAQAGVQAENGLDVVRMVRGGDPRAIMLVREAGRSLGEVLGGCVNFFNPSVIVIGGDLGGAYEHVVAGVREVTFRRALPAASRDLRMVPSRLGDRAGVIGAAMMVVEQVLAPEAIDRVIHTGG
jgi:predicted NBD/HSP70 family sugar kinase